MFSNQSNLLVSATLLLLFVKVVNSDYYCEVESCSNPSRHVFCLFPKKIIDARCNFLVRSGLRKIDKQVLLRLHVQHREKYSNLTKSRTKRIKYPELFWDSDLEEMAQRWADQCKSGNDECRSIHEYGYVVKQNVGHYVIKSYPPHLGRAVAFDHRVFSRVVKDWALTPLNPANPAVKKYHALDRVGCGITITSECDWKASYPAGSGYCMNFYHIYIVCNYSIFKMRLRV